MKNAIYSLLSGMLLLALTLPVDAAEWRQVREAEQRGEVDVFVRLVKDNPLKAFKGVIEVPQPMPSVMAIMGDLDTYLE